MLHSATPSGEQRRYRGAGCLSSSKLCLSVAGETCVGHKKLARCLQLTGDVQFKTKRLKSELKSDPAIARVSWNGRLDVSARGPRARPAKPSGTGLAGLGQIDRVQLSRRTDRVRSTHCRQREDSHTFVGWQANLGRAGGKVNSIGEHIARNVDLVALGGVAVCSDPGDLLALDEAPADAVHPGHAAGSGIELNVHVRLDCVRGP